MSNKIREARTKREYRLQVVLDHVHKYIDRRAFIAKGGVIKYSMAVRPAWNKKVKFVKKVLVPKDIDEIFYDLYPTTK